MNSMFSRSSFKLAILMGFVWSVSLLFSSGIGVAYDVYTKASLCCLAYAFILICKTPSRELPTFGKVLSLCFFIAVFQFSGYLSSNKHTLDYLVAFVVIYICSQQTIHESTIKLSAIMYGTLGFSVLFIYNYASAFSGWNSNAIGMLALFSYAFFLCGMPTPGNKKGKVIFLLLFFVYSILLAKCASRGAALFSLAMALCHLRYIKTELIISNKKRITLILLIPLLISIGTIFISKNCDMQSLNEWSYNNFNKPLFNGRDRLWIYGFTKLEEAPILGHGNLSMANWHNSAITALVGYGILGYALWIAAFSVMLNKAIPYKNDYLVCITAVAFIIIYLQQSVELGFIAQQVFFIPYAILGLMLGRINTIKKQSLLNHLK